MMLYHKPVLLNESIEGLNIKPDGIYVDITFGGGGHSREILGKLNTGRLIAFDRDEDALGNNINDKRFTLINQNFRYLKNFLKLHNVSLIDGLIADLGISSHQIDNGERGFSTRTDCELDMRMDKKSKLTAKHILNNSSEEELYEIFRNYGEVENASRLSETIVKNRRHRQIERTNQLKDIITVCTPKSRENKYYAKVFQALRIKVNDELENIKEMLVQTTEILKSKGRLVVISYHSLEDRLVKNFIKTGNFEGEMKKDLYGNIIRPLIPVNRKVIVPAEEEILSNNRARSAKLRISEKV